MLGRGLSCFLILCGRPRPRALEEGEGLFGSVVGSVEGIEMTTSFAVLVVGILDLRPHFRLVTMSPISMILFWFAERKRHRKSPKSTCANLNELNGPVRNSNNPNVKIVIFSMMGLLLFKTRIL